MAISQTCHWILCLLVSLLCTAVHRSRAQSQQNMQNVAFGKECTLSSYFNYTHKPDDSNIDDFYATHHKNTCHDVTNGNNSTSYGKGNCVFTHWEDFTPRWTVDLGQPYVISKITIYARKLDEFNYGRNPLSLMRGVKVSIDNTIVQTFGDDVNNIEPKTDILRKLPRSGQEVEVTRQKPADEGRDFLSFCEIQVWACDDTHYGSNCDQSCGQCSSGTSCNKTNGECQRGCQSGWQAPMCTQKCLSGTYGDCSQQCSNGCVELCNTSTGTCTCKAGWGTNDKCDDCANGHYNRSSDCSGQCGHCDGGNPCNKDTGYCGRCEPGWKPLLCQEECRDGLYGQDCRGQCGHCSESPKCNKVTGNCTSCQPGFQMPLCQQLCRNGQYGVNCNKTCGQCANNDACNKTNGHCPGSCEGAFKPPLCNSVPQDNDNTGKDSSNTTLIGTIAGVGVFLGVAIIILAVVIVWLRKSRAARPQRNNSSPKDSRPGFTETRIDEPPPALPLRPSAPKESTHVAEQGTETLSEHYDRLDNYEIREDDIRPYEDLTHPSKDYYNTKPMGTEERKQVTTEYQNTTEGSSYEEITVSKSSGNKSQEDIERHRKKKISGKEKHIYTNA